jgi:hypothetical protein
MASLRRPTSPFGTMMPVSPWTTTSGRLPPSNATIGPPAALASAATKGSPSSHAEGTHNDVRRREQIGDVVTATTETNCVDEPELTDKSFAACAVRPVANR